MSGYWFDVALIAELMLVNGVFAGSEIALISLREGQLRALERRGTHRDRAVVSLARDPSAPSNSASRWPGELASATAAVTIAEPWCPHSVFSVAPGFRFHRRL
jgi:putative hemolysin